MRDDEHYEAPDPRYDPEGYISASRDFYGTEPIAELAAEYRIEVQNIAEEKGLGPGAGIAALLLVAQHVYDESGEAIADV